MIRPIEPKAEDCCNSGCNPCIFDVYIKQLKLFKCHTENGEERFLQISENAISQLDYTEFSVVDKIDLENQHKLILFRKLNSSNVKVTWRSGDHFLIKYLSKEHACSRAYTPLRIYLKETVIYDFAILIKVYFDGVVSNYLSGLTTGDVTLWRGPYGHYKYVPNRFGRLIMITQGTGIAPFYSIIKQILNDEEDMTKIILVYCCKNLKTVLFRDELYSFKSYWNFQYEIYLSDSDNLKEPCKYLEPVLSKRFDLNCISKFKIFSELDQFLLCGSDQFMDHFKQLLIGECVQEEAIIKF